ncbi:MAG: UDP-N-acetylmuramoyl-L-alanyl-D-glutamate--2,6-diaminopimelate ligase [Lachnospiraceae bacterium]
MKLVKLLERLDYSVIKGSTETEVNSLCYDSRKVEKGSVFLCVNGTLSDGHAYIGDAIAKGAVALIVTKDVSVDEDVTVIKVSDDRQALAFMSAAFFDYPAEKLTTIGVTGTKGKTTTTYMVYEILNLSGIKTGLIGTIETIIGDKHIPSSHSTPESYIIQQQFREMVDAGIRTVVMEVSSQGLKMKRVAGITYDIGVFTNLEPDHIGGNEHPDFADYLACKRLLFSQCKTGIANRDDSHFDEMMQGHTCKLYTFGTSEECDYRADNISLIKSHKNEQGEETASAGIKYHVSGKKNMDVYVDIPGRFTVYNSLTAIAICDLLGIDEATILKGLSKVKVRGRVETVSVSSDFTIMVDYAHNEMSLRSVLKTLREYNPGRLVCMFGCGGNRSRDRRFSMGRVSGELSDVTIITSDNPRFEEPKDIIADIITGISQVPGAVYHVVEDRYEAICYALKQAHKGDLILIAGKGHEDYQEIKGVKYHMDDCEMIRKAASELEIK